MTNSEKYLKDGVDEEEFINELHYFWWANEYDVCDGIRKFLHAQAKNEKPKLTEDERVILRNIAKHSDFEKIGRDKIGGLYVTCRINIPTEEKWTISFYDHLFQFIKERRRIQYRGTFERRIEMVAEILICVGIAFAIILGFGLTIASCLWLYKNKGIPVEMSVIIVVSFIVITFVVWHIRSGIRESKETKLERRRI